MDPKPTLATVHPIVRPSAEDVIRAEVKAIADTATPEDIATAASIAAPDKGVRRVKIFSVVAALLFLYHNRNNRPFRVGDFNAYQRKMRSGRWGYTHQGIAFDAEGMIDGQHRMAAQATSGNTYEWVVDCGLRTEAVVDMDNGAKRNAPDALGWLNHEKNGRLKANVQKTVVTYLAKAEGRRPEVMVSDTVEQVLENREVLERMIEISERVIAKAQAPVLSVRDSAAIGCLLTYGGYPRQHVEAILAAVQVGAGSENSPLFHASAFINKANAKKASSGALTTTDRIALLINAAVFYARGESITSSGVIKHKGPKLPLPLVPEDAKFAPDVAAVGT